MNYIKIIAAIQISGGVFVTLLAAWLSLSALGEGAVGGLLLALVIAIPSIYAIAAGIGLWQQTAWGIKHSKIVQMLQIPTISTPFLFFNLFFGAQFVIGIFGGLTFNLNIGGQFDFYVGTIEAQLGFGINIIALVALKYLIDHAQPIDTLVPEGSNRDLEE